MLESMDHQIQIWSVGVRKPDVTEEIGWRPTCPRALAQAVQIDERC